MHHMIVTSFSFLLYGQAELFKMSCDIIIVITDLLYPCEAIFLRSKSDTDIAIQGYNDIYIHIKYTVLIKWLCKHLLYPIVINS